MAGRLGTAVGLAGVTIALFAALEALAWGVERVGWVELRRPPLVAERLHTQYDPELGWVSIPDLALPDFYAPGASLHTNSRGFRGKRELAAQVPPGRARIVCSGDSFALGYGVDDTQTWCQQLEALEPRLETVNLGQGGYGLDQAYLWWRRESEDLAHDVHVFSFIIEDFARMESDVFLGHGKPRLTTEAGTLRVRNVPVPEPDRSWLRRVATTAARLRSVAFVRTLLPASPPERVTLEESPDVALAVFEELARVHAREGRQLLLVYLPIQEEYAGTETDGSRAWLEREARARGLPYLDLVPDLRRLEPEQAEALFIAPGEIDFQAAAGHYNAKGNRWVAESIFGRAGGSLLRALRKPRPEAR